MTKLKSLSNRLKYLLILSVLITGLLSVIISPSASAEDVCFDTTTRIFVSARFPAGRAICSTYYVNMPGKWTAPSSWAWPATYTGANNAASFISFMENQISLCGNPITPASLTACSQDDIYQVVSNSAIINAMLGANPDTDFGSNPLNRVFNGIVAAQNDLNSGSSVWEAAVNAYAAVPGGIQWQLPMAGDSHLWDNCNLTTANIDYHGRTDTYAVLKGAITDLYSYCNEAVEDPPGFARLDDDFIVFNNPDGTFFRINRRCGNITGAFSPIVGRFDNIPKASVENVDLSSPTSVDFKSWVDTNIIGAPEVRDVDIRRHFFLKRGGVVVELAPPIDVTDTNLNLNNGTKQHERISNVNLIPYSLTTGDQICAETTVTPGSGTLDPSGNFLNPPGPPLTQTTCASINFKPYLGIFGGDVFAGGGFDSCAVPVNGIIDTFTTGVPALGSGSQLAAFALGAINGFNSAQLGGVAPAPSPPDDLYFANDGTSGNFGGNHCITNYSFPTTPPPGSRVNNVDYLMDITYMESGTYYVDTPMHWVDICSSRELSGGVYTQRPIKLGTRIVIYVKGDAFLQPCFIERSGAPSRDTGDFVYETSWSNAAAIPSVTIITEGSIYINDTVTQIDANLVAKPLPAGGPSPSGFGPAGLISTCVDLEKYIIFKRVNLTDSTLTDQFQSLCGKQLEFNGSLTANHIDWLRTYSEAGQAMFGENPYVWPTRNCVPGLPDTKTCAAEVVINGPETYIGSSLLNEKIPTFDYFTSLPPVL